MPFDNSLSALLNPGASREYFTLAQAPAFQPHRADYSPVNAWWLAELSRLAYCGDGHVRGRVLARVDLRKHRFFDIGSTEGLVAEAGDGSFAVLIFRGTSSIMDWVTNVRVIAREWPQGGCVHDGFADALDDVWGEVESVLVTDRPVFYAGHSLGAALATLAASRRPPRALYSYGAPRVGNADFVATLKDVPTFRVVNHRDAVTCLPPSTPLFRLVHAGELRYITHDTRMLIDPSDEVIEDDRRRRDEALKGSVDPEWHEVPQGLSDHTPVNYVAHLERYLE